jgi:RimJ/RimL family protein N-acetyltransferase
MLHGPVVSLRPMERDDIPRLWEFAQDIQIGLTTGQMGRPTPLAAIEKLYEDRYCGTDPTGVYFGIEAHDLLIGGVEIDAIDWQNRSGHMVIYIGDPAYRRRGCGVDALTLACNYAFKILGLHRLSYDLPAENDAARVVYEKVGFKEEGRRRDAHYRDGSYHDLVVMGLIRGDWTDDRPIEHLTTLPEPPAVTAAQ